MSSRIYFNSWGSGTFKIPAYAIKDGIFSDEIIVANSIARKSNLMVITLCSDGFETRNNKIVSSHYKTTLGNPCNGGGYIPVAEVWFSIGHRDNY